MRALTLTTHAVVGGAIVSLMPSFPMLGLCLAFASHFLLDAIPHLDYPIRSASVDPKIGARMRFDRALLIDTVTIGADAVLGIVLAVALFAAQANLLLVACGAGAAILPDALQFAYLRFRREPLASLQRFHCWIHTSNRMKRQPILGVVSQVAFVAVLVMATRAAAALL
jgi:hypothetical protein